MAARVGRTLAIAGTIAAAVAVPLASAGLGQAAGPAVRARAADPRAIAVAGSNRRGSASTIRLISPRSGALIRTLARASTGNGFALSPNGKFVFVVGLAARRGGIEIRKISVSTGAISRVADGAYPAVSPSSRYLAYATGRRFASLAVMDLRTGAVRVIRLAGLMGSQATLLNQGTVTWLGDNSQVLAIPGQIADSAGSGPADAAAGAGAGAAVTASHSAAARAAGLHAVVVDVRSGGLVAHRVLIPRRWQWQFGAVSGNQSAPGSFLVATTDGSLRAGVYSMTVGDGVVSGRRIAPLPKDVLPVALAPSGDRVLYLVGHTPPALWVATIGHGRLTHRHLLFTDNRSFALDDAAW